MVIPSPKGDAPNWQNEQGGSAQKDGMVVGSPHIVLVPFLAREAPYVDALTDQVVNENECPEWKLCSLAMLHSNKKSLITQINLCILLK